MTVEKEKLVTDLEALLDASNLTNADKLDTLRGLCDEYEDRDEDESEQDDENTDDAVNPATT